MLVVEWLCRKLCFSCNMSHFGNFRWWQSKESVTNRNRHQVYRLKIPNIVLKSLLTRTFGIENHHRYQKRFYIWSSFLRRWSAWNTSEKLLIIILYRFNFYYFMKNTGLQILSLPKRLLNIESLNLRLSLIKLNSPYEEGIREVNNIHVSQIIHGE